MSGAAVSSSPSPLRPTRYAYPEGGYEVESACRVNPEAGEMIQETSLELRCLLRSPDDDRQVGGTSPSQ